MTAANIVKARALLAKGCCGRERPALAELQKLLEIPVPPLFYTIGGRQIAPRSGLRAFCAYALDVFGQPSALDGTNQIEALNQYLSDRYAEETVVG